MHGREHKRRPEMSNSAAASSYTHSNISKFISSDSVLFFLSYCPKHERIIIFTANVLLFI